MTRSGFLLPALVCASLCAAESQTGVVRANGVAVPGATVRATMGGTTLATITDASGEYKLDGITSGAWIIEVEMFRFEPARKEVQISGPSNLEWNLVLRPAYSAAPPATAPSTPPVARRNGPGPPGSGQRAPGDRPRGPQGGLRNRQPEDTLAAAVPELTNQIEGQAGAGGVETVDLPAGVQSESANDAFMLSGTLSRGLTASRRRSRWRHGSRIRTRSGRVRRYSGGAGFRRFDESEWSRGRRPYRRAWIWRRWRRSRRRFWRRRRWWPGKWRRFWRRWRPGARRQSARRKKSDG